MSRVCASFRDSLEARPSWCSPPLDHSSPTPLLFTFGHISATFKHQSDISASVLNSHSVSLCTLLLHSGCHIKGYTYHKGTSQQVMSLDTSQQGGATFSSSSYFVQPTTAQRNDLRRKPLASTSFFGATREDLHLVQRLLQRPHLERLLRV